MPPKRRGMRRFFCCGPKDEAESDLPVKPAKQVTEKVDRSGVTSSGKTKKEEQRGEEKTAKASEEGNEETPTEKPAIPTSEEEATKDHLPAEKPDAPTTEPEGIKEEQHAETPVPTRGEDVARDQARADAPADSTTAATGQEELVVAGPAVAPTENAAEVPVASVEKTAEAQASPVEQPAPTPAENAEVEPAAEEPVFTESTAALAVDESAAEVATIPDDAVSPTEAFFTPAEEGTEEHQLSIKAPAIPEKSESRSRLSASLTPEDSPAEPAADVVLAPAAPGPVQDHSPAEEPLVAEEPIVVAEESVVVAEESVVVAEEPVVVAEEPVIVAEEITKKTSAVPPSVGEEVSPAEVSASPLNKTPSAQDDVVTIQEKTQVFSTTDIISTESSAIQYEDHTDAEEEIVTSREVVPVDPPVVLTKDEDTHSEAHSGTATDYEDDASSHTTEDPEPGITREDSVIPQGSDQKVSMPRLFPNNRQGNILQRVIEAYIINGRSNWKMVQKYLPKPTANGDDSAAKMTKVIMTRMLENCLSEAELTEGRVFLPILREQLAHFYWDDHKDKQAIKLWRKVLGDSANGDSDKFVYRARTNATRSLCNLYFTKALEAHIAGEDPSKHAKKLEEAAGRGADPVTTMWWYAHCSSLMLTAWHQMHDEDSYRALENFRFNAKCAIGKLEGRVPSNAVSGFLLLAETLMTAADNWGGHVEGDENAMRAMSLFLQHHHGVGVDAEDDSHSTKAQTYGACETCDNELSWGHFQTCRYCKVDLCDSCHKCLVEDTLKVRVCSPIHEYFRTSGPAPHEIPKDHVLLDGEQVHYKTWIAMLKDEWAL